VADRGRVAEESGQITHSSRAAKAFDDGRRVREREKRGMSAEFSCQSLSPIVIMIRIRIRRFLPDEMTFWDPESSPLDGLPGMRNLLSACSFSHPSPPHALLLPVSFCCRIVGPGR